MWPILRTRGSFCLNIFSQGGGVWSVEKDQDPLLPHTIPVSYRKCVVNQKKLLVGAEQILRGARSELFYSVGGTVDLFMLSR